jgi:uncharacterized protein involved in exopolysaccharide biosynthesis
LDSLSLEPGLVAAAVTAAGGLAIAGANFLRKVLSSHFDEYGRLKAAELSLEAQVKNLEDRVRSLEIRVQTQRRLRLRAKRELVELKKERLEELEAQVASRSSVRTGRTNPPE